MPNAALYAEGCLAGLNSEVLRQTIVIHTPELPADLVGDVIDHIADRLPALGLRLKVIRCGPENSEAVFTAGSARAGGLRGTVPVLILETLGGAVRLVVVPVAKSRGGLPAPKAGAFGAGAAATA